MLRFSLATFSVAGLSGVTALTKEQQMDEHNVGTPPDAYIALFKEKQSPEVEKAFRDVYEHFAADFPVEAYGTTLDRFHEAASFLKKFSGYKTAGAEAHCDFGVPTSGSANAIRGVAPFPGGFLGRGFGFDLGKLTEELAGKAAQQGAGGGLPTMLAIQGLMSGAGLIQGGMSTVLQVVPPLIPPPVWINQPIPCLPMITGHNCFGAVLYPITAADFVIADVTDAQLDGVIAGFPQLYKDRVGKTPDEMYKACYASYMSMQCASIFPRCAVPMARNEPMPMGRLPLCFLHCIATLVACPGFWITDIMEECSTISAPPMCTAAVFWNLGSLPPQYTTYEEGQPGPVECPAVPASLAAFENAATQFDLYSTADDSVLPSPYAVSGTGALPNA